MTNLNNYAAKVDRLIMHSLQALKVNHRYKDMRLTLSIMIAGSKGLSSQYEKDNKELTYYGRSKVDDGKKSALDWVSYLYHHVGKSSNVTLKPKILGEIHHKIQEGKWNFVEMRDTVLTRGDLRLVRNVALSLP